MKTRVVLALGTTHAAHQIVAALQSDPRFECEKTVGTATNLLDDIRRLAKPPALVLLPPIFPGLDVPEFVRTLVRSERIRLVILGFDACTQELLDDALGAGAVHAECLRLDESGSVAPHRIQRLLRLLVLLGEVRGLTTSGNSDVLPALRRKTANETTLYSDTKQQRPKPPVKTQHSPEKRRIGIAPPNPEQMDSGLRRPPSRNTTDAHPPARRGTSGASYTSDPSRTGGRSPGETFGLIGIVSSTGGLDALERVLTALPFNFPVPLAVVQHLMEGTDAEFVRLLRQKVSLAVHLVSGPIAPAKGVVYVAPSHHHLAVSSNGHLHLTDEPKECAYRPSASVLLESIARFYGKRGIGVVLTGMGDDGADGLLALRRAGGRTIVQDRDTSAIFGMPAAAIAKNAAQEILALRDIADRLRALVRIGMKNP